MIKKGDLVVVDEHAYADFTGNAVVLTDVYASTFTDRDVLGNAVFTAEKLVVDVLAVGNKLYEKVPLNLLTKIK
tara:strand:+ start:1070 stop:1291 length:222 start_codon:yes stop_codon:yes gene_type:complete